jgi:hypothetical protein
MGGTCGTYGGEKDMHTGFWCGDQMERDRFEYLSVDGRIILNWILKKWVGRTRSGLIWLRIGKHL